MGWERKRGKLEELNAALRGEASAFDTVVGDPTRLRDARYVIVLDSDTDLPRDSAQQLVGSMAHWLNRPVYDEARGRVVRGYSILQPRVAITMTSSSRSWFAKLFSGDPGIDPYTRAVSDVYQDLFMEGSFIGKGIYDVDAFRLALAGRLPENRILSHDLLEGAHGRSGLVSDVTLFEDHPPTYAADVSRRHRWIRGDWQITAWLGWFVPDGEGRRRRNPISLLSRWKILDNLRRSFVPVALLTMLLGGWWLPGMAVLGTGVVLAILLLPGLTASAAELARRPTDISQGRHLGEVARTLGRQILRELFALVCLPYEAFVSLSAIGRTAVRVWLTKRSLLEWRTARDAQRARAGLAGTYAAMWIAPATAVGVAVAGAMSHRQSWPELALASLWALAPGLAWRMSLPNAERRPTLEAEDRRLLHVLARRTWCFFETVVGPDDNHLPPDNFQEAPPRGVAHRTSPTNMGLALTANLAAYDLGYISAGEVVARTSSTLGSMDKLQRFRGHFYNWYDTQSLATLRPAYVSTVDSGNLAAHLIMLRVGLAQLVDSPVHRPEVFEGLADALDLTGELIGASAAGQGESLAELARIRSRCAAPRTLSASRGLLRGLLEDCERLGEAIRRSGRVSAETQMWLKALAEQCRRAGDELDQMAPWADLLEESAGGIEVPFRTLDEVPTLAEVVRLAETWAPAIERARGAAIAGDGGPARVEWLARLQAALSSASERAAARISEIGRLTGHCSELSALDYEFLYDRGRQLLSIGYNVADHRLDASFYDLLASEARLASFVAISQGSCRKSTGSGSGGR